MYLSSHYSYGTCFDELTELTELSLPNWESFRIMVSKYFSFENLVLRFVNALSFSYWNNGLSEHTGNSVPYI